MTQRKTTSKTTSKTTNKTTNKTAKTTKPKKKSNKKSKKKTTDKAPRQKAEPALARALRVDHAGEYGAQRIYQGQLAALEQSGGADAETLATIREMLDQERAHLEAFNELLHQERVRPTALQPAWHIGGWALGAATGLLGAKAAMACTIAVEEVIEGHYADQVEALERSATGSPALREKLARFAEEEAAHGETARASGGEEATGYPALRFAIRGITKAAIRLSERV